MCWCLQPEAGYQQELLAAREDLESFFLSQRYFASPGRTGLLRSCSAYSEETARPPSGRGQMSFPGSGESHITIKLRYVHYARKCQLLASKGNLWPRRATRFEHVQLNRSFSSSLENWRTLQEGKFLWWAIAVMIGNVMSCRLHWIG